MKVNSSVTRTTKIVATVGPATLDPLVFNQLIAEGVDYVRINTKYGDYRQYDIVLSNIKANGCLSSVPIIFDIKTPDVLEYAKEHNITVIALSFAKDAEHVKQIRKIIPRGFLIAKIESLDGLNNLNEIIDASDGIMIARGDLGSVMPLERIPVVQKDITYETLSKNKFLITATEMLSSMTKNPVPTRAEASDIANAVLDHSSAVMLSEETAIGKYPVEAVRFMRRVIEETEDWEKKNTVQKFARTR
jgi:pyruvate kinase